MKKIILLIIMVAVGIGYWYMKGGASSGTKYDISLSKAQELSQNPTVVVLDVRSQQDFDKGALTEGTMHIDVNDPKFVEVISTLDKKQPYLVYCSVGRRSAKAIVEMEKAGFTQLYHMNEGTQGWEKAGLSLKKVDSSIKE